MYAAANMAPDWSSRRSLSMEELAQLDEPAVIYEHFHVDSDGAWVYVYTIGGFLNGRAIAIDDRGAYLGGATVAGDVILVHAKDREEADAMASAGLEDTIEMIRSGLAATGLNAGIATHGQRLNA